MGNGAGGGGGGGAGVAEGAASAEVFGAIFGEHPRKESADRMQTSCIFMVWEIFRAINFPKNTQIGAVKMDKRE